MRKLIAASRLLAEAKDTAPDRRGVRACRYLPCGRISFSEPNT